MGLSVVWLVSDGHQKAFRIIFSILSLFYSFIFVWLDSTSILSLCAFILTFLPLSRLFLSSSWTGASSWTFPPSTSVWLTRRASMTWRPSPPEPSDRSLLNYQLSHPFLFPFFFFCTIDPCSFCFNKKWHTVEIQASCPCRAFSLLSSLLICT